MMRYLVPLMLAAFAVLAAPGLARSGDSTKPPAEEPADTEPADVADDAAPAPPDLAEVWLTPVDGRTIRGEYIDLGEGDRLLLRYVPSADSGIEIERVTDGEVVWRVRAMPLGVRHTQYKHEIYAHVAEGQLVLLSDGTSGTFNERRELETGELIERSESNRSE
ncbi:hypothetical protein OT109_08540 [Phycisphaeraceae bacterium D3-23]